MLKRWWVMPKDVGDRKPYMTLGDLKRLIKKNEWGDDVVLNVVYWTIFDIFGKQEKRACTQSFVKDWTFSDYGEVGQALNLRAISREDWLKHGESIEDYRFEEVSGAQGL